VEHVGKIWSGEILTNVACSLHQFFAPISIGAMKQEIGTQIIILCASRFSPAVKILIENFFIVALHQSGFSVKFCFNLEREHQRDMVP